MTIRVATALADATEESRVVQTITASVPEASVVRRCRDLVELRAVLQAVLIDVVVADGGLRGLDHDVASSVTTSGTRLVVVSDTRDDWIALGASDVVGSDLFGLGDVLKQSGKHGPSESIVGSAPEPGGRVVVVWGPQGAPGRSTIAIELAASLARREQDSMVVDLDTLGPSVAQQLGLLDDMSGLAGAARLASQGRLDPPALAALAVSVPAGPRVLVGLPDAERWSELRASSIDAILRAARSTVAWTVLDIGPYFEADDVGWVDPNAPQRFAAARASLLTADAVVCVSKSEPIALSRLLREVPKVRSLAPTADVRVVLNGVKRGSEARQAAALVSKVLGIAALQVPADDKNVGRAVSLGGTVAEVSASAAFVLGVDRLRDELLETFSSYHQPRERASGSHRRLLRRAHRRHRHRDAGVV